MMFGLEPGVNFILFPLTIIRNYPSPEKCSVLSSSSCFGHAKVLTDNSGLTDMFNQETQKAACFKAINSELEDFSTIVLLVILEHWIFEWTLWKTVIVWTLLTGISTIQYLADCATCHVVFHNSYSGTIDYVTLKEFHHSLWPTWVNSNYTTQHMSMVSSIDAFSLRWWVLYLHVYGYYVIIPCLCALCTFLCLYYFFYSWYYFYYCYFYYFLIIRTTITNKLKV